MKPVIILILLFTSVLTYCQVEPIPSDSIDQEIVEEEYYEEVAELGEEIIEIVRVKIIEFGYSMSIPSGVFNDRVNRSVLSGGHLSFMYQLQKEKPLFIGGEINYTSLGGISKYYEEFVDNDFVEITGSAYSNILGLTAVARYFPKLKVGPIEPYVEARIGTKWLFSNLSEVGYYSDDSEFTNSDLLESDFAVTYGFGGGIQIRVAPQYYINIKSIYHSALSSKYRTLREKTERDNALYATDAFEVSQSATNLLRLDLGFSYLIL